jgi:hypothetical protein
MIALGSVATASPATVPGHVVVLTEDDGRWTTDGEPCTVGQKCVVSSCAQAGDEGQKARTYCVAVVGPDSYFIFSNDARPGQVYTLPGMEITVLAMRHAGEVVAFTVSLSAETAANSHVFYSDGRSFKLLKPDQ